MTDNNHKKIILFISVVVIIILALVFSFWYYQKQEEETNTKTTKVNIEGAPTESEINYSAEMKKKFPFIDELPYETKLYYIDIPLMDDTVPIYIDQENEEKAKESAINWLKENGADDPSKFKIEWRDK